MSYETPDFEVRNVPNRRAESSKERASLLPSGTLVVVHSEDIYIPVWATKITIAGQYHHTGASFGALDWRIGGTTIGGSQTVFDSSYPADTVRRTLDPLPAGYAGTTKTLDLYLAAVVTTTMFSKQSDGPVSRFYS